MLLRIWGNISLGPWDAVRNEPHRSRKSLPNCALHPTRARKLFRVFKFRGRRGRVS